MGHTRSVPESPCAIRDNRGEESHAQGRTEQLSLRYNDRFEHAEQWAELLDAVGEVVRAVGLKQVAYDLDQQPSVLAHALAERERHYVRAEWLPYLVAHAPSDRIVALVASWRHLEVKPRHELTPAEELRAYKSALDLMPDVHELVRRKAGLR
jgi:hypothetical protein